MKTKHILFLILLLGFLLRTIFINSSPPALYGDELTIALDSNSILKTGRDQLGNFLPLTFPMGAGRPAGYVYGSIPFIAIFGPTAPGVRALSILSGMGIIILLYYIGRKLFSQKVGLLAALIAAFSPWDISLSRGGFEAHFASFLALLGVYLFIKAKEKPIFFVFSALSFGLTLHTYPTYKVSLLLFLPLLLWYQGVKEVFAQSRKYLISAILVLAVLGSLSLSQTFVGGSETRFFSINIFSNRELNSLIEQKINLERQISQLPKFFVKFFHNKPVEYTKTFIENYLQNFSLDFLVLHGDRNPRHNMATMGEIYAVELILIITALLTFWQKEKRLILFLLVWVILAPIPTAIIDLPHALRSSFMMPPLVILVALGLLTVLKLRNRLPLILVILFFAVQFIFFIQKLYFLAPNEYSNFWSYPAKLASKIATDNKVKYDFIILSNRIDDMEFAYPVYSQADARVIIDQNQRKSVLANYPVKRFENVFIASIPEDNILKVINSIPTSVLYLGPFSEKSLFQDYENITDFENKTILILKRKP